MEAITNFLLNSYLVKGRYTLHFSCSVFILPCFFKPNTASLTFFMKIYRVVVRKSLLTYVKFSNFHPLVDLLYNN